MLFLALLHVHSTFSLPLSLSPSLNFLSVLTGGVGVPSFAVKWENLHYY